MAAMWPETETIAEAGEIYQLKALFGTNPISFAGKTPVGLGNSCYGYGRSYGCS